VPRSAGGCCAPLRGGAGSPSDNAAWAEAYLYNKWYLDPSNRLATIHQHYRQTEQSSRSIGRTVTHCIWTKVIETESKQKTHTWRRQGRCIWAGGSHFRSRKTTSGRHNHFRYDGNRKYCRLSSQENNPKASGRQKSTPGDPRRRIFTSR